MLSLTDTCYQMTKCWLFLCLIFSKIPILQAWHFKTFNSTSNIQFKKAQMHSKI